MNRWLNQFRYSLEKKMVDVYLKAAIGATGAITLDAANSKGIASVVRNSAGKYTITFNDTFVAFFGAKQSILLASGSPGVFAMVTRSVDTKTAKQVVVEFLDAAGAAADIASGATLNIHFEFKDTTV